MKMKTLKTFALVLSIAMLAGGCWNTAQVQKKKRARKGIVTSTTKSKTKTKAATGSVDGHEWIDLGLPGQCSCYRNSVFYSLIEFAK